MHRRTLLLCLLPLVCAAEERILTLRQAVDRATEQNPDVLLARLQEQKAALDVKIARDPFTPRVYVGSGLAYSNGFPMSIEGSAPSIVQARAFQSFYNRPRQFQVAEARETARGASIDTLARRDEVAFRTAALFLDAERARRNEDLVTRRVDSLEKVRQTVEQRVTEGRDLAVEARRAGLLVAQARQRFEALAAERAYLESSLAVVLGYGAQDTVRPAPEPRGPLPVPATDQEAVDAALKGSKEVRKLESQLQARQLAAQAGRTARLPIVDLVAQYALFARFNNYEDFFQRFQRNNGQIGISLQLPIVPGSALVAQAAQAAVDVTRLRTEILSTRDRLTLETRRSMQDLRVAEAAREVARLDLELSREDLSVALARLEEGRASLRDVETARGLEAERFLAFYDAQHLAERARLAVLRQTGTLIAVLRQ